jgi:hypothetical protein
MLYSFNPGHSFIALRSECYVFIRSFIVSLSEFSMNFLLASVGLLHAFPTSSGSLFGFVDSIQFPIEMAHNHLHRTCLATLKQTMKSNISGFRFSRQFLFDTKMNLDER